MPHWLRGHHSWREIRFSSNQHLSTYSHSITFKTKKSRKLLTHFSRAPHAVVSNWVNCLTILHTRGKSNERTKTKQRCMISITFLSCLDAWVVKGVDLRSTAGNCAWVRTPQLTIFLCISFSLSFFSLSSSVSLWGNPYFSPSLPFSISSYLS